jgi:hypothetical protein
MRNAEPDAPEERSPPRAELPSAARPSRRTIGSAPSLAAEAAKDYRTRARYPRSSTPLAVDEPDPILREREVTPISARGPRGEEPTLVVYPARPAFAEPEPVVLHAYLARGNRRVPALQITGQVLTEDGQVVGQLLYTDEGAGIDALARDRLSTAVFDLPPDAAPRLAASYLVKVSAITTEQEERIAAMSFQYARPHAHLTGRYRDALVDGSLLIGAEIEVAVEGRFHIEGTLYDSAGKQAVAWAQVAAQLSPGRHWLDLPYYGLILRESGIESPYLLRYLALSTTTEMPNAKSPMVTNAHLTQRYAAAQLTNEPFNQPDLMEAADRLERDGLPSGLQAER